MNKLKMNDTIKWIMYYIILDQIWLIGNKASHLSQVKLIQNEELQLDLFAGILFYIFSGIAYTHFIKPLSKTKKEAFMNGAVMGFLMYMTFDLTNKAIFKKYEWNYAVKDVAWGTFVIGLVSYLVFKGI